MRKFVLFSIALGISIPTYSFAAVREKSHSDLLFGDSPGNVFPFQNSIRGNVSGPHGPISGATINVIGGKTVHTDSRGNFSVEAANGATLRISYLGYKTQSVVVNSSTLNITLEEDQGSLDEVVVVGYGALKQRNVTGAVTVVNVEKTLGSRPIPDVARGLQGAVPGLTITVPSGEVGSNPLMRIRGQVGSIAGSSNPLILVDNVEVPNLQMINPNDVEGISVLKDAASTAIYGAKAAFGVILITTKSGAKTESNRFNYSSNLSMQAPFKELELAGLDGLEYTLEASENRGNFGQVGTFWRVNRESFEKAKEWEKLYGGKIKSTDPVVYNRDWYFGSDGYKYGLRIYDPIEMMVKKNPLTQTHNIGLLGKRGTTDYSFSAGYLGQQGMMKPAPKDDFIRYSSTLKLSSEVSKHLTLRGSAMYSDATKSYPNAAHGFGNDPWLYIYRWSRLYPIGTTEHGEEMRDPYWDTKNAHTATRREKFLNLNFGSTINLTSNWDIKGDYTYTGENNGNFLSQNTFSGRTTWTAPDPWLDENGLPIYVDEQGQIVDEGGVPGYRFRYEQYVAPLSTYVEQSTYNSERHTFNAFSTYNLNVNQDHEFKFLLGTNIVAYKWRNHSSRKTNLLINDRPEFDFAIGANSTAGGGANWDSQAGFFGRINYAFKEKYLLESSVRYDGTSKFPVHLKWRWFPSVSAGWILTSEQFMESLNPVMSFAKFRASFGIIGDQSVANSLYIPTMTSSTSSWLDNTTNRTYGISTPGAVSKEIRWQDIEHLNIGTDLRFFKNSLGVTVDWYQRATKNMIITGRALPATFGVSAPQGNFGNLRTRGWEVALDYNLRFDNGLLVNLGGNLGDAITITTKGPDWNLPWENRSLDNNFTTGRRYGDIYGYVTDRLYQKEDFVYDEQGNNVQIRIIDYQGNSRLTNKLVGDNPVYQTYFETVAEILEINPGDVKFVDVNGDGHINPGNSTYGNPGDRVVIGNSTPRYEFGFRLGAEFKGFDFAVFLQGIGKRSIWGSGQLAIPGFHTTDGAMPQAIAGDFWKEDRTDAFYPRAWSLNGVDEDFTMRRQSRYMLDMSYTKIKNITLGYSVPKRMMERAKLNRARLYLSLENYFLFDNLRGLPIDPEAISGYSILRTDGNYNLGRTGTGNPPFKSASLGLQIDF